MKSRPRSPRPADARAAGPPPDLGRRRSRLFVVLALLSVLGAIVIAVWPPRQPPPADDENDAASSHLQDLSLRELAPPRIRPARHRNTAPDVGYIGSARCVECHAGEHASFLHTPHSQALGRMGDAEEPQHARIAHAASGIRLETRRVEQQESHRMALLDEAGSPLVECEFPIEYHIGSGNHSRSYLASAGPFLFESPLTWYRSRDDWGLSPGYDRPLPHGFERMIDVGCLVCHAGRVEMVDDNRFHARIVEGTIGCESCHGPGQLHADTWRDRPRPEPRSSEPQPEDLTIVNPARLSRDEAEQICSFCHLRGKSTVVVRGRRLTDFRPGLTLADFRSDFVADDDGDDMKVTGHVEQVRRSKCYSQSDELTCITCHDPHARPAPAERQAFFRQKCVDCHAEKCGLEPAVRQERQPTDDCVACHMPRGETDLPHFAFTHHRIGIHAANKNDLGSPRTDRGPPRLAALVPTESLEHLPEGDQLRSVGLAYAEYSERQRRLEDARECRARARRLLRQAYERGMRDAATLATLAALEMELDRREDAVRLAREALDAPNAGTGGHENARFVLANAYYQYNDLTAAQEQLDHVVRARYRPEDWLLLAEIQQAAGRSQSALESLLQAGKYNPFRPDVQELLSVAYARTGDKARANQHQQVARRLLEILDKQRRPARTSFENTSNAN